MRAILTWAVLMLAWPTLSHAVSTVIRVDSNVSARTHVDTMSATQALAYCLPMDTIIPGALIHTRRVNTGDVNLDGKVTLTDVIYLANAVLGRGPATKSPFYEQTWLARHNNGRFSLWHIFVDSVGVTK